jgi:hypothetical protein
MYLHVIFALNGISIGAEFRFFSRPWRKASSRLWRRIAVDVIENDLGERRLLAPDVEVCLIRERDRCRCGIGLFSEVVRRIG